MRQLTVKLRGPKDGRIGRLTLVDVETDEAIGNVSEISVSNVDGMAVATVKLILPKEDGK